MTRRLARLISYIHHTNDYRQYCHVGNTAQQCRLGSFHFAGDFEVSKSTSWEKGSYVYFGSRTFVTNSWMCKKQTSVSHSSTESDIISLDAGLRMDGLLALDLWDVVLEVLRWSNSTKTPKTKPSVDVNMFFRCGPHVTGYSRQWIRTRFSVTKHALNQTVIRTKCFTHDLKTGYDSRSQQNKARHKMTLFS